MVSKFQEMINLSKNSTPKEERKFGGAVMLISIKKLNASANGSDGIVFIKNLYKEYIDSGSPKNVDSWIYNRIKDAYKFIDAPPIWIGEEPDWPFLNGAPMVFIGQFNVPAGEHTNIPYSAYLFYSKVKDEMTGAFEIKHKTVIQYKIENA